MENIRNFAIIAHIDHGKSTLADRMLELTGTISPRRMKSQFLDSNPIERERGITIKLAPVRMNYSQDSESYILNLIDTPGHVDFSYEVNRSLAACEGAILLVDATQGIQAQTLAHLRTARALNLVIIPVVNKIDVSTAEVDRTISELTSGLGFTREEILLISAKTGQGVPELLRVVIDKIPPPKGDPSGPPRALVFSSNFDQHLGVVAWVRLVDGRIKKGDKLYFVATRARSSAVEIGIFNPDRQSAPDLSAGEVGYIVTNFKDISLLNVGDTVTVDYETNFRLEALPGYKPAKPVVFVSFYPLDGSEINHLRVALDKLKLQDSSLHYSPEYSPALGNGFRVGLLGLLHADIVQERLEREFGLKLIAAAPSVEYQLVTKSGSLKSITKAVDMPDPSVIQEIREPVISLSVITPQPYLGQVLQLCQEHRGSLVDIKYLSDVADITYRLPLMELIHQFYDQLKSVSQGFATLDYEIMGFYPADLVKLDCLIGGDRVDALSQIVPANQASQIAKNLAEKLKSLIPRHQFEVSVQVAIGGRILARSDVRAFRKDVTAKLSGGDQTRKDKLLKKQKKGKARMKHIGRIELPQEVFLSILGR